ncbi:transposase [Halosimplex pelagicum]|uniref:Transposase n=1 Tax=Halosimplex pelagicum TaxID=869886 RepID=A0A7D5T5J0_9EURY|nr:transposase [Halosimplex pelagicum]QLH82408.1 transposase [Halosimplex pelagicum]
MSDGTDRFNIGLSKQAANLLTADTDWVTLASELDVSRYAPRDAHPEWSGSLPFRPMFLSYLWATVEQESLSGIPDRLSERPEIARAFGFEMDTLPSESSCKPVRLESRFEGLQRTVESAADDIRTLAAERGAPIGCDLLTRDDAEEDTPPSNRTVQRLLRKKGRQVLDELKSVAIPSVSIPRPDEAVYEQEELLVLEAIASIKQKAAHDSGEKMGDMKNPNPDLDDPFYEDGPSGETLLESLKQMSVDQIATVLNFALRKTYTRAKPRLRELEHDNGSRFGTRAKVALDITYVAYYGDRDEMKWVQGTPDDKGYNWCHKFATAVIVGENTHFVVGVCPLGSSDYAETDAYAGENKSYYVGDVARRLLSIAEEYVTIRMVYADREFHAADVIQTLAAKDLDYVIPAQQDKHRIGPMCDQFEQLKRGHHEANDTPLYVKEEFPMHGAVKGGVSNSKVYTNVVVLPPDEDDETHDEGSPQPFLTSLDVSDELALDRRRAREQIETYSDRGAIENSYASIKEAAAWTTSKEFEVRWFHFAFGCVVYNMWLLVDFLTQDRIGVIETRKKPRITLSRFLDWLDKELITLI